MVKFQLARYGEGGLTSYPFEVVTPESLASDAGKGFERVSAAGLPVEPVNDCERENGKPPVRSVRIALRRLPV
jgi:hypothetical protein